MNTIERSRHVRAEADKITRGQWHINQMREWSASVLNAVFGECPLWSGKAEYGSTFFS